jgi:hypothetical protein
VVRLGEVASEVLAARPVAEAARLGRLCEVVARGTDGEFREHCTLGGVSHGVLTVLVDDESWVTPMRLQWHTELGKLLSGGCRDFHVSDIRFAAGRGQLRFALPMDGLSEKSQDGEGTEDG